LQQGCIANNLDLDVVMIIIDGAFSGIVQNWLMNMAGYDLYKQAPALVDNVLRMFMPGLQGFSFGSFCHD
ncbi:TetR/AcrR family transcriptional regulator C-terminal domain-containing protein, partial [Escherichia coli]|uniref:TetR/AcrR family transcriptional regulator C-terminal domain-containing protein n=1 Tax=Escherichia coli TaxID=562 RepID=UPI000AEB2CB0